MKRLICRALGHKPRTWTVASEVVTLCLRCGNKMTIPPGTLTSHPVEATP